MTNTLIAGVFVIAAAIITIVFTAGDNETNTRKEANNGGSSSTEAGVIVKPEDGDPSDSDTTTAAPSTPPESTTPEPETVPSTTTPIHPPPLPPVQNSNTGSATTIDFPASLAFAPSLGTNATAAGKHGAPPKLRIDLAKREAIEPGDLLDAFNKNAFQHIADATKVKEPKVTIISGASSGRQRAMQPVWALVPTKWRSDPLRSTTTNGFRTKVQGSTYELDALPPGTLTGQFLKASDGQVIGVHKTAGKGRLELTLTVTGDGRGGIARRGATLIWTGKVRCEVVTAHPEFAERPGQPCPAKLDKETITWTWSAPGPG